MILCDRTINRALRDGRIRLEPIDAHDQVQPSSVDLRLGNSFRIFDTHSKECIDPFEDNTNLTREVVFGPDSPTFFILYPGEFVLASTMETIELPDDLVARVDGKSSLGRLGLLIHATAGFIDPGFRGQITLELSNVSTLPIRLRPAMKIAQISFMQMDGAASRPYGSPGLGSKYQDQRGATASEYARKT